ncbi:MAG: hypothetical protein H6621_02330 [Halobacteriovoraceae bacterium]|nr:hypothetical protein [Halobacteriovoraceae bacterium]MCB9093881.1 hypothetical protein [Halobacteriovoraceae bacterium]
MIKTMLLPIVLFFLLAVNGYSLTAKECKAQAGLIINTLEHPKGCFKGYNLGDVKGMRCPCICCADEVIVDCKIEKVAIQSICHKDKKIHLQYKYVGNLTVDRMELNINSAVAGTFVDAKIDPSKKIQIIPMGDSELPEGKVLLGNHIVHFKDSPFFTCNSRHWENLSDIPLKACP